MTTLQFGSSGAYFIQLSMYPDSAHISSKSLVVLLSLWPRNNTLPPLPYLRLPMSVFKYLEKTIFLLCIGQFSWELIPFYLMCMDVLSAWICLCTMCVQYPWGPELGSSGPLEEQSVLLSTEPSLCTFYSPALTDHLVGSVNARLFPWLANLQASSD